MNGLLRGIEDWKKESKKEESKKGTESDMRDYVREDELSWYLEKEPA